MFELDNSQKEAISQVCQWFTGPSMLLKPYFCLTGRAGTGKSTIIKEAVTNLGLSLNEVAFIAPTGKASLVMRNKGISDAITLHSLIYIPVEEKNEFKDTGKMSMPSVDEIIKAINDGKDAEEIVRPKIPKVTAAISRVKRPEPKFIKKASLEGNFKLIVCDEASLINDEQIKDLESFNVPVVYIGDSHQLKPVKGVNSRILSPDFSLEHIFRQAENNPIIALSSAIVDSSKGTLVPEMPTTKSLRMISTDEFFNSFEIYTEKFAHQILCGTNEVRTALNNALRAKKGFTEQIPMVGDKLMCWKNNYSLDIVNGLQGIVKNVKKVNKGKGTMVIDLDAEDGKLKEDLEISLAPFMDPGVYDEMTQRYLFSYEQFEFGYACTVHKSQGSEWKNVVYIQSFFRPEDAKSMHYTAVTRASERLVVVDRFSRDDIDYLKSLS